MTDCFRLPKLLLPRPGLDLRKWAVIACDQHTAEPAYWQRVADEVGDAPSTLHLVYPEAFLGEANGRARIEAIQRTMRRTLAEGLLREHVGAVLVERRIGHRVRRGLMLELDLEHYDFRPESQSLVRPTEGTIVARLAPRIAVREGAELELPHVLVLIDDRERTVIEPLVAAVPGNGAQREAGGAEALRPLYATELMMGGGHVSGYALNAHQNERIVRALRALAEPQACARRYGLPAGTPPMLFAVGDGNHSLATAKSCWEQLKREGGVAADHPARWALVEVENIHDAALEFEPIHRLLLGVKGDVRAAAVSFFGAGTQIVDCASAAAMRERLRVGMHTQEQRPVHSQGPARQTFGLIGPGANFAVVELAAPPSALAVANAQAFVDHFVAQGAAAEVDYVHGDDVLERLAQRPDAAGLHIGTVSKSELLTRVMHDGPLPRKTFSMGEADEKRFYVEARRIR
jgi:hypothetical protein